MFINPVEAFLQWFASIPPTHREEIALHLAVYFPGFARESAPHTGIDRELVKFLSHQKTHVLRATGTAIALDSIIEFAVMKQHGRKDLLPEQTANLKELQQQMAESLGAEAGARIEKLRVELPFKAAQWAATRNSWEALRREFFTPANYKGVLREDVAKRKPGEGYDEG